MEYEANSQWHMHSEGELVRSRSHGEHGAAARSTDWQQVLLAGWARA